MSERSSRSYLVIAAAIVIAALVVGAAVITSSYLGNAKTETSTSTSTATSTTTATQTTTELSIATTVQTQTVTSQTTLTVTSTSTFTETSTSSECSITGEPAGLFIRILSDSSQTSVVGALVIATNDPAGCGTSQATGQRTINFTTSADTQWYPLNSNDNFGYSFLVAYSGQTYTFHASLRPVSVTCATLYVPSGRTNTTITEFQGSC